MVGFRLAAVILAVWFVYLGAIEVYGMLSPPARSSLLAASGMAAFALMPAILTSVAWKQLR